MREETPFLDGLILGAIIMGITLLVVGVFLLPARADKGTGMEWVCEEADGFVKVDEKRQVYRVTETCEREEA